MAAEPEQEPEFRPIHRKFATSNRTLGAAEIVSDTLRLAVVASLDLRAEGGATKRVRLFRFYLKRIELSQSRQFQSKMRAASVATCNTSLLRSQLHFENCLEIAETKLIFFERKGKS